MCELCGKVATFVWGLGFRVLGFGFGFGSWGLRFRV